MTFHKFNQNLPCQLTDKAKIDTFHIPFGNFVQLQTCDLVCVYTLLNEY